jgi:hypothetical protein
VAIVKTLLVWNMRPQVWDVLKVSMKAVTFRKNFLTLFMMATKKA